MDLNIDLWMEKYLEKLKGLFGSRLEFVGLQGSYGRGEATEESDIDVVVILDHAAPKDLAAYSNMLDTLPYRRKMCGFISGHEELENWERSDLFQFYYDTTPILGNMDFLKENISREDIRRAVRIGACNLYHMCGHNMIHEKSPEILKGLYKSSVFTVQAIFYLQTGTYIKKKTDLLSLLQSQEQQILKIAMDIKKKPELAYAEFETLSDQLFRWSSQLMRADSVKLTK